MPLRRAGCNHLVDDCIDAVRIALHRRGQRPAAERTETDTTHRRGLTFEERHPVVIDDDHRFIARDDRARLREVKGYDRNLFAADVAPYIELRPVRERKYTQRLAPILA